MNPLRIALVTPRFWPLVGGLEKTVATLASGLRQRGNDPVIVTARWDGDWPAHASFQGSPLVRLDRLPSSPLAAWRYGLSLRRWLRRQRAAFDVACVSYLRLESYVTVGAFRGRGVPVVLRAERAGAGGDCHWQATRRGGACVRRRCRAAADVIATDPAVEQELLAAGYAPQRVHRIAPGIPVGPASSLLRRSEARAAIAEINPDLSLAGGTAVVVYVGRLSPEKNLRRLLQGWPAVLRRRPLTKLWLIGDGPDRDRLFATVRDLELQHHVFLPGTFDEIHEVLLAANVFVAPAGDGGWPRAALEAAGAGLPIVAVDRADWRACPAFGSEHVAWVPENDHQAWAGAIVRSLESPPPEAALRQARRRVHEEYSVPRMVEQHLALFQSLVGRGPARTP